MIGQNEIKQKIWAALDKLRATSPFSLGDTKLLELIGTIKGIEKLESILSDEKTFSS